jgi:hypothetical protein
MNNADKALIYDECIRESDMLQRDISRLKSQYAGNIPEPVQIDINVKEERIRFLVKKLESLFLD